MRLRNGSRVTIALLALGLLAAEARAQDAKPPADWSRRLTFSSPDGRFTLQLSNRVQVRFDEIDFTPDPAAPPGQSGTADTSTIRIRRARTTFEGKAFGDVSYKLQFDWVANPSPTIIDAEFRYTRYLMAQPWFGRGKAFFGRQQLTSSGRQQFVDRSILDAAFFPGRQNGIALIGEPASKVFEYQAGLYNGNGITNNVLNDDDEFMTTARVVWHPFGNIPLEESAFDYPSHFKIAIGAAALQNQTRSAVTPAAGTTPAFFDDTEFDRFGGELAMRFKGLNAVAEYVAEEQDPTRTTGSAANPIGVFSRQPVDRDGYYAQVGYLFPNQRFELAVRHAEIKTEADPFSGPGGNQGRIDRDETEDRVAFSYYLSKHDYKFQVDYGTLETENLGVTTIESDELRAQFQVNF